MPPFRFGSAFRSSAGLAALVALAACGAGAPPAPPAPKTVVEGAATPGDCAIPLPARMIAELAAGKPIRVGIFGDSFGDGVWVSLLHGLDKQRYEVVRLSQANTGFVRTERVDVIADTAQRLQGDPVDIAVVSFGANDTQGMIDGAHTWALLSDGWKSAYAARVDKFVSEVRRAGVLLYWLGLPKMRSDSYDAHVAQLNDFDAQHLATVGVPFLSTTKVTETADGVYADHLPDLATGKPELMRTGDGIHMTTAGYGLMASPFVARLDACYVRARFVAKLIGVSGGVSTPKQ